ncbi:MAG TPA: ATP-binding protein [Bacteroidota bacterium]|nr:ATP-binding protein [Bacteroidota bacterium]
MSLHMKALFAATGFIVLIVAGALYLHVVLEQSTEEVITTNRILTEAAVQELNKSGADLVDSLWKDSFLQDSSWTKAEEGRVDGLLGTITARELSLFQGTEGGFYFYAADQFLGYAFPTSPPPKPAFGPPPRSYHIIREQARLSVLEARRIVQLHQFDPATFPLVTEPIVIQGRPVGAVWARVHIERLLPTVSLTSVLIVAAIASALGFLVVIMIAWTLRKNTEEIRIGLDTLQRDATFRFPERGGVFGVIMRSINAMVAAQSREQELRAGLEQELHQQDKMATLGKLVSRVAHEVKTPLAVIKTRIQMWQRKLRGHAHTDPKASVISNEAMALVVREIDRLADLVKRLLVFSKPVSGRPRPTDLRLVLEQSVALVLPSTRARRIRVRTAFAPDLPALWIDPQGLEQVFLNVTTNALDAMNGDGQLDIATALAPDGAHALVTITDNGPGIPPDILPRVFDPFFTTKEHGVGLGLSIAYEIVRAHGGRIDFRPRDGGGTICSIALPLRPVESPGPA